MKKITAILMSMLLLLGAAGCSSYKEYNDPSANYGPYIQSLLDVSYKHDATKYLEYVDDTKDAAEEYYDNTMAYWAYQVADYFQMVLIDDATEARMIGLMEDIFEQAKYEVADAVKSGDYYTVQVTIYPLDFTNQVYDEVAAFAQDFSDRIEAGEFGDYVNDEAAYTECEIQYANSVMDILETYVDHLAYADAVEKIVKINVDEDGYYGISENDQYDLESYLIQ